MYKNFQSDGQLPAVCFL